jgi:hypothetical protein
MREPIHTTVLWIGGGSGAGKSTLARAITRRFDVQLYAADAYGYAHLRRMRGSDCPDETPDQRWLVPTPAELVARFLTSAAERFPQVLSDLATYDADVLTIAEGPTLLPDLVRPHIASPVHALFLLPTADFSERMLTKRGGGQGLGTSNPDRAHATLLARNRLLHATIRDRAHALGLPVVEVDGSRTFDETERFVADKLQAVLRAGPRAADGDARRRMRRRENAATHANTLAYLRDIGVEDVVTAPPLALSCECQHLGCTAELQVAPGDYSTVLARAGRYVVGRDHAAGGDLVVGRAGDATVVASRVERIDRPP